MAAERIPRPPPPSLLLLLPFQTNQKKNTGRPALATRTTTTRPRPRHSPRPVTVRAAADPDDEIIPLLAPRRQEFSPAELDALAHPHHTLGGATVGEELARIREQFLASEAAAAKGEARLHTAAKGGNWDGDVYVGAAWNELTWLAALAAAVPVAGLAFAAATKGVLWGLVDFYGY